MGQNYLVGQPEILEHGTTHHGASAWDPIGSDRS